MFNLFVVWAATGLWHGANWTFLVWGLYFLVLLLGEKYLYKDALSKLPGLARHLYALLFIILGWVWFRSDSLGHAISYFRSMLGLGNGLMEPQVVYLLRQFWPELLIAPFACAPVVPAVRKRLGEGDGATLVYRLAALAVGGLAVCRLLSSGFNPFIYFRF